MADKSIDRLYELIAEAEQFKALIDREIDEMQRAEAGAWMAQAMHIVATILPNPESPYRKSLQNVWGNGAHWRAPGQVAQMSLTLVRIVEDAEEGLLTSIADRTTAKTFDDLLDHAALYLEEKRHEPAGVLAGVVFEDAVRRICAKRGIDTKGMTLEPMINALAKTDAFSGVDAKQAKACAGVRTSATHALWNEFNGGNVETCIEFTRQLIKAELDG